MTENFFFSPDGAIWQPLVTPLTTSRSPLRHAATRARATLRVEVTHG